MMRSNKTIVCLLLLLPMLLAGIGIAIISLTDMANASVMMRIRIETLLLCSGIALSVMFAIWMLFTYQINRARLNVEQQQQQMNREEHQRFIFRLDHELKNPLTAIHLGLENLAYHMENEGYDAAIGELKTQAKRLSQLTNDLRKLALFDEHSLALEEVSVAELLNETKELANEIASDRQLQLTLPTAPWPVPNIRADRDLLQLAIYNVIENAIKYSSSGDHVDIRATDDKGWVKIEIADTGIGIPNQDINVVCEELFRGQNTAGRSGTGIGLSLVKRIIDRHHGQFDIVSKEHQGTRISISLPVSKN